MAQFLAEAVDRPAQWKRASAGFRTPGVFPCEEHGGGVAKRCTPLDAPGGKASSNALAPAGRFLPYDTAGAGTLRNTDKIVNGAVPYPLRRSHSPGPTETAPARLCSTEARARRPTARPQGRSAARINCDGWEPWGGDCRGLRISTGELPEVDELVRRDASCLGQRSRPQPISRTTLGVSCLAKACPFAAIHSPEERPADNSLSWWRSRRTIPCPGL